MTCKRTSRNIIIVTLLTSILLMVLSAVTPFMNTKKVQADKNPAAWILCKTEDGKTLYNAATTDLVPYSIRSKSNVTQVDSYDNVLNKILEVSGFNFKGVNESILGRKIKNLDDEKKDGDTDTEETKEKANPNSSAKRVNPFDRFGVAGLTFSNYSGEWKYYQTDGCDDGNEASKTEFGAFYTDRKEPKSSFNEVGGSKDPRSIQYRKGVFSSWMGAFNNLLTNFLFNISKLVVTITIALIGLSFTDITSLIGLGSAAGGKGLIGLFNNLYTSFFLPMLVLVFLFTAIYIFYTGVIKRQIRKSLINGLGQSFLCMLMAAVIAGAPNFWIPLPSRIATYGEAVVINALGQSSTGQGTLCSTDVGSMTFNKVDTESGTLAKDMEKIGTNMRATMGCRMWEEFLLKPWARGQFGVEYSSLDTNKLANVNKKWTKNADVPLGGDYVSHNLALFQLSTQTDVHAQLSPDTGLATDPSSNIIQKVDGISSDWWRVADTLSNYDETTVQNTPPGGGTSVSTEEQKDTKPLSQWNTWVGNNYSQRYGTALLSIIFGALGSLGPLVFGLLTAIYSVGVTFLMAISPVFLLLGCWAGNGQVMFRKWLETLVSTMIKKVVCAGLLLISFSFTMNALNLINVIGWLKAFMLLLIMTFVLLKNRQVILDTFSKVNFGGLGSSPVDMFNRIYRKGKSKAADAGYIAQASVTGGIQAKKLGMTFAQGARIGGGTQLKNTLMKTRAGRYAHMEMERVDQPNEVLYCSVCSNEITKGVYFKDNDNNVICRDCAREYSEDTTLFMFDLGDGIKKDSKLKRSQMITREIKNVKKSRLLNRGIDPNASKEDKAKYKKYFNDKGWNGTILNNNDEESVGKSWLSYTNTQQLINLERDSDNNLYWDNSAVTRMIETNMKRLDSDIDVYEKAWQSGDFDSARPPAVPEPLKAYLSSSEQAEEWHAGEYDRLRNSRAEAWAKWYSDNSMEINNLDPKEREETIDKISNIRKTHMAQDANPDDEESTDNDE